MLCGGRAVVVFKIICSFPGSVDLNVHKSDFKIIDVMLRLEAFGNLLTSARNLLGLGGGRGMSCIFLKKLICSFMLNRDKVTVKKD